MLLDTASLYYRSFYALPESIRNADGISVGALRGFIDILSRLTTSYSPTTVVACWDDDWRPQWRVDLVPSYKAHRVFAPDSDAIGTAEDVPDALELQLPMITEFLELAGIPIVGASGYEADDVIGTLSTATSHPVDIVTGDRDLFQLIDDDRDVRVISTIKGMAKLEVWTDASVRAAYGVSAAQYIDFSTMRGDASDGLPGVPGIGEKTAATLLTDFTTLDRIRSAAERGEGMSAARAARIVAAGDYLDRAVRVVAVARDLELDVPETRTEGLSPATVQKLRAFAERWSCTAAVERFIDVRSSGTHDSALG